MFCKSCGTKVWFKKVHFSTECEKCNSWLHSCIQCNLWNTDSESCKSMTTDSIRDREGKNFCERVFKILRLSYVNITTSSHHTATLKKGRAETLGEVWITNNSSVTLEEVVVTFSPSENLRIAFVDSHCNKCGDYSA